MNSTQLSASGKQRVQQARRQKGWKVDDPRWLREASKILQPDRDWDAETYFFAIGHETWRRFLLGKRPIRSETFQAFCQVLGLPWQEMIQGRSQHDWQDAPELLAISGRSLYGRTEELQQLERWVKGGTSHLIEIDGMGGIGKSTLLREAIEPIKGQFEFIIWRSLKTTSTCEALLFDLTSFLSQTQTTTPVLDRAAGDVLDDASDRSSTGNLLPLQNAFLQALKTHRCLVVLDDWEVVMDKGMMEEGTLADPQLDQSAAYRNLLLSLGKEKHSSCVFVLSCEKPAEFDRLSQPLTQRLKLKGLPDSAAIAMMRATGLTGTDTELTRFSHLYSNNPLILELAARQIRSVLGGNIAQAIAGTTILFNDAIADYFHNYYPQLSPLEQNILYWLAIRWNTATFEQLMQDIAPAVSTNELMNALYFLIEGRSLVELNADLDCYLLSPVFLSYTLHRLIEQFYEELIQIIQTQTIQGSELIATHALMTIPDTETSLEGEQRRRIVRPILKKLGDRIPDSARLRQELEKVGELGRSLAPAKHYVTKNISLLLG
ncbi:MAG: NB-ARC domain-containing protein [Oculatellaceae cyanobacterium Prado106]|jgi:hypothetical protein|nr:NB-ARC domain-containing protein [Oculatellaceae cyanobacterium Prado106]